MGNPFDKAPGWIHHDSKGKRLLDQGRKPWTREFFSPCGYFLGGGFPPRPFPVLPVWGLIVLVDPFRGGTGFVYLSSCGAMSGTVFDDSPATKFYRARTRAAFEARQFERKNTLVKLLPFVEHTLPDEVQGFPYPEYVIQHAKGRK